MYFSLRTLATMSLSTLAGLGAMTFRIAVNNRATAGEFRPIKEAEMPKGFPAYTPVGQIEVKHYPAYRKALASGPAEFWTLFQHITRNHVRMTAPVEMDYGDPRAARTRDRSMSFCMRSPIRVPRAGRGVSK